MFCVQVPIPNLQPRQGHCVAAFSLSPGITEVVIFGGTTSFPDEDDNDIADTRVLRFGECKSGTKDELSITLYLQSEIKFCSVRMPVNA